MTNLGCRTWISVLLLGASSQLVACSDPESQAEQGEAGSEAESGTSTSDGPSDTDTDTGLEQPDDGCPAFDPEFNTYFFNFAHPDWPYAVPEPNQDPTAEFGTCTVTAVAPLSDEHTGENIDVSFDCLHEDGNHYPQRLVIRSTAINEAAIATWQDVEPLEIRFLDGAAWSEYSSLLYLSIRAAQGQLLFAGAHDTPASPGQQGVALAVPPGEDSWTWWGPFLGFTLRDAGCDPLEVVHSDFLGFADVVERLAVEFELEVANVMLHDKNSALNIQTSGGSYDLVVGQAFDIVETSCGDCEGVYVHFHAMRQPD